MGDYQQERALAKNRVRRRGIFLLPNLLTTAALFLLGTEATHALMQQYNTGTQYATADVLASLWTYLASVIMPIGAGLGASSIRIFGPIKKFASS